LINRGYGRAFFWDGRVPTLEEQVLKPIQDPNEMDLTIEEATARVKLDAATMSRALASYVRSILSGDSPYDRFVNGDRNALTAEQQLGLQIFRGKGIARPVTSVRISPMNSSTIQASLRRMGRFAGWADHG
jgi:cytochrome c peroxidase